MNPVSVARRTLLVVVVMLSLPAAWLVFAPITVRGDGPEVIQCPSAVISSRDPNEVGVPPNSKLQYFELLECVAPARARVELGFVLLFTALVGSGLTFILLQEQEARGAPPEGDAPAVAD